MPAISLLAIFMLLGPGAEVRPSPVPAVPGFEVQVAGWDGRISRTSLPSGGTILGWPGGRVRITPNLPRGWSAQPLFEARRAGGGWELRTPDRRERLPLTFRITDGNGRILHADLVLLVPLRFDPDTDGYVRGGGFQFPMGHYPIAVPARFRPRAEAWSRRFYVVRDTAAPVSRHFTLGMFVSRVRPGRERTPGVHLLALDPALIETLERVQAAWTRSGRPGLVRIESPFRTPDYNNAAEAGRSQFSLHMYGAAVDILISRDTDRLHDDINGDGVRDQGDILPLARLIKRMMVEGEIPRGGIGVYEYIHRDGREGELTVHLDIRGYLATWGQLYDSDTVRPAGRIEWK